MEELISKQLKGVTEFSYTSFDRVLLRGYLPNLFIEGSVITLLRNLGFKNPSNGVLKLMTDQLNSHIVKQANTLGVKIHWWGSEEKEKYHSKIDFVEQQYSQLVQQTAPANKVVCIIKSVENTGTFAYKEVTCKDGKKHNKLYSCHKFVSQYYIYIHDKVLGLCYLKISSYLPFVCEFYMNGHNYLKRQFDNQGIRYKMQDNSFVAVSDLVQMEKLAKEFQPSTALNRVDHWMDVFFRFDKGCKSTRSKLLSHKWYTYQTEISSNIIFKSATFAKSLFERVLQKNHTIGLPDRLTEIFGLSKPRHTSKSVQHTYVVQACMKHWLGKNSVKCYNKGDCLLRVETTINNPELPGLKLKKPACNLQAYYWYGHGCNSRYLKALLDVDLASLSSETHMKYQQPMFTGKGSKVAAPDLRKPDQLAFLVALLNANHLAMGFRNKDLRKKLPRGWKTAKVAYEMRKLRVRGAIKKKQGSNSYQLTTEGFRWVYYSIFVQCHFVKPLLSRGQKKALLQGAQNPSKSEQAYMVIDQAVSLILSEFGIAA